MRVNPLSCEEGGNDGTGGHQWVIPGGRLNTEIVISTAQRAELDKKGHGKPRKYPCVGTTVSLDFIEVILGAWHRAIVVTQACATLQGRTACQFATK